MTLQNHIHLSDALGSAPESAPDLTWKVLEHTMTPLVSINIEFSRTMHLREQVFKSAGLPVVLMGYTLKLKIFNEDPATTATALGELIAMAGRRVYYVDVVHPANGASHTAAVQTVLMGKIDSLTPLDTMMRYYEPTITLHPVRS